MERPPIAGVRAHKVALSFLALHIPAFAIIAWINDTDPLFTTFLTIATFLGPFLAYHGLSSLRAVSVTCGVAEMLMGGVLVHIGQGPVQIEMHFYFFAVLAMLVVFGNPLVIVAAAVTVTLHHLVLWMLLPSSVFNYGAPLWVIGVHAAFIGFDAAEDQLARFDPGNHGTGTRACAQRKAAEVEIGDAKMPGQIFQIMHEHIGRIMFGLVRRVAGRPPLAGSASDWNSPSAPAPSPVVGKSPAVRALAGSWQAARLSRRACGTKLKLLRLRRRE